MTPEEIIKAANAKIDRQEHEITRLKDEVNNLTTSLNGMSSTIQAEATAYHQLMETNHNLYAQINHLEKHIAFLESESNRLRMSTQEAIASLENQLAAASRSNDQWIQKDADLSSETRALEQRLASQVKEANANEQEIRRLVENNTAMQKKLLLHETQTRDLEHNLEENKRLAEIIEGNTALINARDDLNSKLTKAKQALEAKVKSKKKMLSAALERVEQNQQLLRQALKEKKRVMQQNQDLQDQLTQRIEFEKGLQRQADAILAEFEQFGRSRDNYKEKEKEHVKTRQICEDQVASLK